MKLPAPTKEDITAAKDYITGLYWGYKYAIVFKRQDGSLDSFSSSQKEYFKVHLKFAKERTTSWIFVYRRWNDKSKKSTISQKHKDEEWPNLL